MYAEPLSTPSRAADIVGDAYAGATWQFFETGTSTPQAVYASPALAIALPNPLVADAGGLFPPAYFDPAKRYRGVCKDASGTVVLHDLDPINPGLCQALASADGAARIAYRRAMAGAVVRTLAERIAADPVDVADFGPVGTADDTAVFQAAYDAAAAAQRPLRLPSGWFHVSGLVFHDQVPVYGAGAAFTWFSPTADGQTVITIAESFASGIDRSTKWRVGDFSIDLSTNSNCVGLRTSKLVRTVIERVSVLGDDYPAFTRGNTAWRSEGDQYCAFREICLFYCTRGLVMTNDLSAGGGNNNHFDALVVNACQVNVMLFRTGNFPMGFNQFTNISLQSSGHCSLYLNGVTNCLFTMLTPEGDWSNQATLVAEGQTVKRGTVHADNRATARFIGYDHASNNALMRITADNNSSLEFCTSGGAAVNTEADATSSIRWDGRWGNGSVFRNTRVSLAAANQTKSVQAWHPASALVDSAFPNECALPVSVPMHQHFGATSKLVSDPQTGFARELAFLAQAGTFSTNTAWVRLAAADFAANDTMWGSLLLKSDRDTQIGFNFAQSSVSGTIDLKAGQWTRLLVSNFNYTGQVRYGSIALYPLAADQPVLRVAQPVGLRNPTGQQTRLLTEEHRFNPKDPLGMVLRLSAPPSTGSWTAGTAIHHAAPAAGTAPGWVCVASGTPGTWKAMAALAA